MNKITLFFQSFGIPIVMAFAACKQQGQENQSPSQSLTFAADVELGGDLPVT